MCDELILELARTSIDNPTAKSVVLAMACYSNNQGQCFPSMDTIARDACVSVRSAIRAIHWLESNGIIKINQRSGTSNIYQFCIMEHDMEDDTPDKLAHEVDSNITKLDITKKNITSVYTTSGDKSAHPTFDAFWAAYPKKRDKGHAELAFKKHSRHTDPAIIIAGAHKYSEFVKEAGTEMQFIPYPTTWLNGKRWEDDLESELQPITKKHGWLDEL